MKAILKLCRKLMRNPRPVRARQMELPLEL